VGGAAGSLTAELERAEAAAFAEAAETGGWPLLRIAGAACAASPHAPAEIIVNRVAGLGLDRSPTDAELDEIDAFFAEHSERYAISLAVAELEPRLRERGFEEGYAWMKFSRGTEPYEHRPTELRIEQTEGDEFADVIADGFGMPRALAESLAALPRAPHWHCFLAYDAGVPVASGALFAAGEIGWLGFGCTRPAARGRGAQTALLAARIDRARELGLRAVTTETGQRVAGRSSGSYDNILRAGFAEAYLRPNYVKQARS
jgi:GNAT superfamily N-acetyltransferase